MDIVRAKAIEEELRRGRYPNYSALARVYGVSRQWVSILAMRVGAPTPVRGALVWRICERANCGREFGRTAWQGKLRYCSRACYYKARRAVRRFVFCAQCGKMLTRTDKQLAHAKSGLSFCTVACRHTYYTPHLLLAGWVERGLV